jgi:spectinomycin phosphotransferase
VLLSDEGELFIIDWDNTILAPRERDLMFFVDHGLDDYLEGYRRYEAGYKINQTLINYYIMEWALQEIVDYGTRILFDDRFDASGRLDAWQQFQALFELGGDADRAFTLMDAE